jgi:hypothetical protein
MALLGAQIASICRPLAAEESATHPAVVFPVAHQRA